MKRRLVRVAFIICASLVVWLSSRSICLAATGEELVAAFGLMQSPTLSSDRVLVIADYTIEHHDFSLTLESGLLYLYDPITIDSKSQEWGGLFVGKAKFNFKPSIPMETDQLRKYYGIDSLAFSVGEVELIFGQLLFDKLRKSSEFKSSVITGRVKKSVEEQHRFVAGQSQISQLYRALKGIVFPGGRPFLLANAALGRFGQTIYTFDPYDREEVSLSLHRWDWVSGDFFELVSSYSQYSIGSLATLSGMSKDQLSLRHYDLSTTISKKGLVFCDASLKATITKPIQMLRLELNSKMTVNSVKVAGDIQARFRRCLADEHNKNDLWLFFDKPYKADDSIELVVTYEGKLTSLAAVGFTSIAEESWYPGYNSQLATFDLQFFTPAKFSFFVSGKVIDQQSKNDTLRTVWSQPEPVSHVSFGIGTFRTKKHLTENVSPILVYYDPGLHVELEYDRREDTTIAQDLANSLKLFAHHFGPYQYSILVATELAGFSEEVAPGMVNLGLTRAEPNAVRRDQDRLSRAYKVATQWWGGKSDYQSYHDNWLAVSFAEYSALMYVQATAGNYKFLELLGKYHDRIFAAGESSLTAQATNGSIMLGPRASSTNNKDDSTLAIYNKGTFVLHMLRNLLLDLGSMSDERFLLMMREWYMTNKGRKALTYEFTQLVESHVGEDMSWFFDQYVLGTALPTYHFSYETERLADGNTAILCHIEQSGVPDGFKMYLLLEIEFATGNKIYMRVLVDQLSNDIELPLVRGDVKRVKLNPFHSVLGKVVNR